MEADSFENSHAAEHAKKQILAAPREANLQRLPSELLLLPPREREIAQIIFNKGAVTAMEICGLTSGSISNGAVRTMLMRLLRKEVIRRHRSGYGKTFLYVPAGIEVDVNEVAFRRLAEDFFNGCLEEAAAAISSYLARPCR